MNSARFHRYDTGLSALELFNECAMRVMDGRRNWPDDIAFVTFMRHVMWSVGDSYRRRRNIRQAHPGLEDSAVVIPVGVRRHRSGAAVEAIPSTELSPEEVLIRIEHRKVIRALFASYPLESRIIEGLCAGLNKAEIGAHIPHNAFEAAWKRVTRTLAKYLSS
jgi:DNA-directed RNA polymerase specialized sigma24 family protein